jgi:hypothetical protein
MKLYRILLSQVNKHSCGSGIVQPGTEEKFGFPHPVVVFLNNSNDAFDYPNTVAGLFKLANDILGGISVPVNCTDCSYRC